MEPEILEITSPDGYKNNAVLKLPDGDGPFPGVVAIHGGMGSQTEEVLMDFARSEKYLPKRLVRQGYAVLISDYRHPSLTHLEVDDTIAAYHTLCAHPKVRADRVALCGTSHGGVCAIFAGMRIRPACIVAEEAATDLAYHYRLLHESIRAYPGELDGYIKLDKELWDELAGRLGGTPDEVPEAYEKASGHAQARKIQSPILIVSGNSEYLPHCLTMVAALLKAKKDCTFAMYENAPHGFWCAGLDLPARLQADEITFPFLEKHLKR